MPKSPVIPKYRLHRGTGQAFVQVKGHRRYLGVHGTDESREKYRRFVAELCAAPAVIEHKAAVGVAPGAGITVVELVAAYLDFASGYYVKHGEPSGHLKSVRIAMRTLRSLYGSTTAVEFGPLALRAVQQHLADKGNARSYINGQCEIIRRMFRWAASQELLPVTVYQALATVPGLKQGRSSARETAPIPPVADAVVDATLPFLPAVVADMVRFQRLVGCRPGEVCAVRPMDLDRSEAVWCYTPSSHKTEHHGRERRIFVGPKAQAILLPYLLRAPEAHCFSPIDSEAKRHDEQRERRKTKVQPSQRNRRKPRPKRQPQQHYTKDSYNRAVRRACDKAGIAHWSPNRLRHAAATEIRKRFGIEAAQVCLGHSKADVTQVYAERDFGLAARIMAEVG